MVSTLNNADLHRFQTHKKRMQKRDWGYYGDFFVSVVFFFHAKNAVPNDMQMGKVIKYLFKAYVW